MTNRRKGLLLFFVGTAVLLAVLILSDAWPWLRGPAPDTSEWYWPYTLRPYGQWWVVILVAVGWLILAAWWLRQAERPGRKEVWPLSLLFLLALALQIGIVYAERTDVLAELLDRTLSLEANGYFTVAAETVNLPALLRNYPAAMTAFPSDHVRTHPPGLVTLNRLTIDTLAAIPMLSNYLATFVWPARCIDLWLLSRPAAIAAGLLVWALLPPILAALIVFPTNLLARDFFSSRSARFVTLMSAAIPALLIFAPTPDQIAALLSLLAFLALQTGLKRQRWLWGWFGLSGVILSFMTFISIGYSALLLILLGYGLFKLGQTPVSLRRAFVTRPWLAFMLGAASIWLIYWLIWRVPPWEVVQTGLQEHYKITVSQRRYAWWLAYNLVDLLVFGGFILVIGWVMQFVAAVRFPEERQRSASLLALVLAVTIFMLNVAGTTRGETGRLWLFLMPLIGIVGGGYLGCLFPNQRDQLLLLMGHLLVTLSLAVAWQPIRSAIISPERPFFPEIAPETQAHVSFGDTIDLDGATVAVAEDTIQLTLFWRAVGQSLRPYTVFNQLLNEQGQIVAQQDNWPVNGQWPPTCWQPGETVVDAYTIILPEALPSGTYTLITGWYDARNGRRLSTNQDQDFLPIQQFSKDGRKFEAVVE